MKLKNIITAVMASVLVFSASSCEDMLKVDSKSLLYDDENNLDSPSDTVYSVLGIIQKMQKIADRTVLLGEIRGDLVAVTDHANKDLIELYDYNLQNLSKDNRYNNASDYYAVINNCNFFLSKADTSLVKDRKNVFTSEYITVLSFRAWTYLQLAQIYGEVYFVDKPITSGDDAVFSKWKKLNIKQLADTLLAGFEDRFMDYDTPNYGNLGGENSSTLQSTDFFIPVRLIMGDLALWSEQYERAAAYYHDYLTDTKVDKTTSTNKVLWYSNDWVYLDPSGDTYASGLGTNSKQTICYIPMESDEFDGIISDLPNIFNSTVDNDYYYQLTRSNSLSSISRRQNYCFHYINPERVTNVRPWLMDDKDLIDDVLLQGDLRLQSIMTTTTRTLDEFSSTLENTESQRLIKINPEKICLYRDDVVFLRLAEALNRAELPQMAFKVLKTGLTQSVIDSLKYEKEKAISKGMNSVVLYDKNSYLDVVYTLEEQEPGSKQARRSIDGQEVKKYNTKISSGNTIGIHSRGCGDADLDTTYTIGVKLVQMGIDPSTATLKDSIQAVEEFLIDEMALETCFEGYRFGDLMRIAMHRAADSGNGGFADNDFLAKRVATREDATRDDPWGVKDDALYNLLKGDGSSLNPNWFLKLVSD